MKLIGSAVRVFGPVQIADDVLIEDGVVVGHPSAEEVLMAKDCSSCTTLEDFYQSIVRRATVIGKGAKIRSGTVIYSGCIIGKNFDCGHNVLVRENVRIGDNTYVKSFTEIMKNVFVGSNCRLAGVISDNTVLEDCVSSFGILTHKYEKHYTPDMSQQKGPLLLSGCIVGRGAVVLGQVEIGENAIIGANAFVNFNVPAGARVVGPKAQQR